MLDSFYQQTIAADSGFADESDLKLSDFEKEENYYQVSDICLLLSVIFIS